MNQPLRRSAVGCSDASTRANGSMAIADSTYEAAMPNGDPVRYIGTAMSGALTATARDRADLRQASPAMPPFTNRQMTKPSSAPSSSSARLPPSSIWASARYRSGPSQPMRWPWSSR